MRLDYILCFTAALGLVSGCASPSRKNDQSASSIGSVYGATFAPFFDAFMLRHGAVDLLYDSASFRHKNGRWPNDFTELSAFVKQSDGYLMLGEYARVDLKSLADGGLEVCYVRPGQTNETKLTFGDMLHGK